MTAPDCRRCDGTAIDPSGFGTCSLCGGVLEPTQAERVAQLIEERNALREACELVLAFHAADAQRLVARGGRDVGAHELCRRVRAALAKGEP